MGKKRVRPQGLEWGAAQNAVAYGGLAETLINDKEGGGAKRVFSACQPCCF